MEKIISPGTEVRAKIKLLMKLAYYLQKCHSAKVHKIMKSNDKIKIGSQLD
jgi:hypothetical protein